MTAVAKLRELLRTRPAMPNTEELVRWWRTTAELLPAMLDQHELQRELEVKRVKLLDRNEAELRRMDVALAEASAELAAVRLQHRTDVEGFESALVQEQHEKSILELAERSTSAERDAYRAMVCDLLASATPNQKEHPSMSKQWDRARELLKHGPRFDDGDDEPDHGDPRDGW